MHDEPTDFKPLWQSFVAGYAEIAQLPYGDEAELNPFLAAVQLNFLDYFYNATNPAVRPDYASRLPLVYGTIGRLTGQ